MRMLRYSCGVITILGGVGIGNLRMYGDTVQTSIDTRDQSIFYLTPFQHHRQNHSAISAISGRCLLMYHHSGPRAAVLESLGSEIHDLGSQRNKCARRIQNLTRPPRSSQMHTRTTRCGSKPLIESVPLKQWLKMCVILSSQS